MEPADAGRFKSLTKSTIRQTLKKPARQGSKLADKGAYLNVSDRWLQVLLTQQAKILSTSSSIRKDFCVCGVCQRSEPADAGRFFSLSYGGYP